ncbi:MAG: complex I subunit 1 family protein [Phycisphaeraceae bacterium]
MPQFVVSLITILVVLNVMLLGVTYAILLERKISAWIQNRIGPNRVGFSFGILPFKGSHFGLGQALADGLKMLLKEDYTPPHVQKGLFLLAPVLAVVPALIVWAIVPWGGYLVCDGFTWWSWLPFVGGTQVAPFAASVAAAPISIGIVYPLAIGSLAVYGVVVAGYSSNNKYAFLGGLRATAQMLSYEIPMGLGILTILLMAGTMRADLVVNMQAQHTWFVFQQPLLAVIFFVCMLAETNRAPFDLAECEQELVGGFHTEYSSMKFGLLALSEYIHVLAGSAFFALLFLGGWDIVPFVSELPLAGGIGLVLLKAIVFAVKVFLLVSVVMWVRWTLPRFRFDQLMKLAWRGLIPVSLALMMLAGLIRALQPEGVSTQAWNWLMLPANVLVFFGAMVIAPLLPKGPPVNRRVELEGSRFSPPTPALNAPRVAPAQA